MNSLRIFFKSFLAICLIFLLGACSAGGSGGFEAFTSPDGRYGFLYPTGWTKVAVQGGPEVVFHDLINGDETLSLVISKLENDVDLEALGSAKDVGDKLIKEVQGTDSKGREVNLVEAKARETSGHIFYDLDYSIKLPDRSRHEYATVVIDRGYLYTLAASSSEIRWPKVKRIYEKIVSSFTFLI